MCGHQGYVLRRPFSAEKIADEVFVIEPDVSCLKESETGGGHSGNGVYVCDNDVAVIVSSPPWIVACVLVSAAGYLVDLLLKGHSLAWTLTPTGRELVVNQWVDLAANAGAKPLHVLLEA